MLPAPYQFQYAPQPGIENNKNALQK